MTHAVFRQVEAERFMRAARSQGATEFRFDLRELTITARIPIDRVPNSEADSDADNGVRYGKENWDEE